MALMTNEGTTSAYGYIRDTETIDIDKMDMELAKDET